MAAVLSGGEILADVFTTDGAIAIGDPVYRSAAGVIKATSDTDQATTEAHPAFAVFNGNARGGDAADGDTGCSVAIGPCEVNALGTITVGATVKCGYDAAASGVIAAAAGLTAGDIRFGQALGAGADGGKVVIDVRPSPANA